MKQTTLLTEHRRISQEPTCLCNHGYAMLSSLKLVPLASLAYELLRLSEKFWPREFSSAVNICYSDNNQAMLSRFRRIPFLNGIIVYFLFVSFLIDALSSSSTKEDHDVCEVSSWTIERNQWTKSHISAPFIDIC